jgi:hypothetical protein
MAPIEFDRKKAKTRLLDDDLVPLEIAEILKVAGREELPLAIRSVLASGQAPVGYVRESWSEDANYYTARRGARSLIVAFCGGANRLGVPTSYFLQMLRDDLYDVVVLRDPRRLHYDQGVQGLGSLLETTHRIRDFAETKGFQEVITYGVSMGGYPALRAGLLLNATRAISVSGEYCWHIGRLTRKGATIRAFDLLCPCVAKPSTQMVAVVPTQNQTDLQALEILRQTFPECLPVTIDAGAHNITSYFYYARLLRLFYACLFEYWDASIRDDLLMLLVQIAGHSNAVESQQAQRISALRRSLSDGQERSALQIDTLKANLDVKQRRLRDLEQHHLRKIETIRKRHRSRLEKVKDRQKRRLEAVYRSRSWLVTKPLRIIAAVIKRVLAL